MGSENVMNIIVMATVFGLVFSVWCICIFLWLGQYLIRLQLVQKRLGIVKKETEESKTLRLWRETKQEAEGVALGKLTLGERLERLKQAAGWRTPAQMVILGVVGAAILGFIVTYILGGGAMLGFGISVAIMVVFSSYTRSCIAKRSALFETQLVDALGICARALRAGLPLLGSFQLVSEEIGEPLGGVFSRICHEQLLGLDMKDSIRKVAKTVYHPELKLFATSIAIQLKSGGNLADLMDSLASVIRARMRLSRRVRVLTAQTQLSKRVLIALPIFMFFLLTIIAPTYMVTFYKTTVGHYMLGVMVSMVFFGAWVMNRLSVLRI
ncbi:MAG: type II secretion system F family protein [Phycisphaerales bacterium]|jgi:tight adherence protein B